MSLDPDALEKAFAAKRRVKSEPQDAPKPEKLRPRQDRDGIIAHNPLPEYLRAHGYELWSSGDNFITNACPCGEHKKPGHRPVSIDVSKQVWYCNDHKNGGSVIDWEAHEKKTDIGTAMQSLNGGSTKTEPPTASRMVCAYDYTDENGKLLFQCCRFQPKNFKQRQPDSNGGWVWNLKGVRKVLYHLAEVIEADRVVIAEGEKDADNLRSLGFTATTNPMGAGKWSQEYVNFLRNKDVVVFSDIGDGKKEGENHAKAILKSLVGNVRSVKYAVQPKEFHDISNWIDTLHRLAPGDERGIIEQHISETPEFTLPVVSLRDATKFLGENLPTVPAQIIRHIMHEGSKMIVGGTSKGRKTMALLDAAVSVATGTEWWGFYTKRGPICYINFEIQEPFFWFRVNEICKAKDVVIEPEMFFAWNLRGRADAIENLMGEILGVLKQKRFVLVIIDPVYKALGNRDENRAGDVAAMLNQVEKIAVETGAAVAFGAHYSKGNQAAKESIDRIGGSGVFARDPDSILTMTAHEEEEHFVVDATLRNFKPLAPFVLKWAWPLFTRETELDPKRLKRVRGGAGQFESKYSADVLLDQLSIIHGLAPKDAVEQLKQSHDISRRTVYRWKDELETKKLLAARDGEWFRTTKEERNEDCATV